jgi:hypothetical protein
VVRLPWPNSFGFSAFSPHAPFLLPEAELPEPILHFFS